MPHIHELIDFCVETFIVHNNEVLLRKHDKYGFWLSVGGHIELDEDPVQAAIREVKEEVGLDVELYSENSFKPESSKNYKELIVPQFLNRHRVNETHEHIALVYFAKSKSKQLVLSEKEQTEACKWFTLEELDNPDFDIKDLIKFYAKTALSKLAN